MSHRLPGICFGAASGFSLAALAEALARMTAESWLAVIGSLLSALAAWYSSRRTEQARAHREQELVDAIRALLAGRNSKPNE